MATTLTLEEESFVKELKAQGKNTQQIMVALASKRVGVVDSRDKTAELAPLKPTVQRVLSDMPSDFLETGRNIKQSITDSGQNLRETWQDTNANLIMKSAATLPQMGKSVLDVAGEAAIGYGKLATTDEFEKAVTKKIGETGQQIADTGFAKSLVQFRENLSPEAKFVLDKIIAPQAEVMFEGATMGGGAVAGKTAGKVFEKGATEAVGDFAELTKGVFKTVPDTPIVAPVPSEVKKTIVSAFDTAIKPNLISKQTPLKRAQYEKAVSEGLESIADNVENLKFVDETTGEVVTGRLPQNLKELVDGMEQTKQAIFKKYDDLAERAGEAGARIDTIKVANELDEIINSRSLKLSNPQATKYAEEVRERLLQTKALSAIDAQDVIRNYNNSLDAFYRNPTPEGLTRNAVDALVANRLRSILDDEIGAITGANYQGIKRQYASLKAIERDVMRAYNRDARRNAKGLIDFTDVLTGGQLVSGLLSMNPAAIGQGLGGKLIASGIKMLNDPNRKVKQIFEELGRYKRPADEMSMPTRKQLPSGKPNAPRSEVSSGKPVVVGGQTARGRVEPGITERAKEGAVRRSDSEPKATSLEKQIKDDTDAVNQAVSEMEAELSGDVRVSYGANLVKSVDGEYYRFNELPSWIPKDLRDGNLMNRVLKNILDNKKPREGSKAEELQKLVQQRVDERIKEIKKGKGDVGIFSNDTAFAVALMAGGTYFYLNQDKEMFPIVAIGSMMAVPEGRNAAIKAAKMMAKKGGKLPESYKRKIAEELESYDAGFFDIKRDGAKVSIAPDDIDIRLEDLQKKNFSGNFTNGDALEAEELMAKKGILFSPDGGDGFNKSNSQLSAKEAKASGGVFRN
jgi:hypothetical protein